MPKINRGGKRTIAAMAVSTATATATTIAASIKRNKNRGKIDTTILKGAFPGVRSGEVVLTPPQYKHIMDDHPDAMPILIRHGKEIFSDPDYVIEDSSDPNTVLVVKTIEKKYKAVVRLAVNGDDKSKKNSIITFHRITDRYLKNKLKKNKVLYEKSTK